MRSRPSHELFNELIAALKENDIDKISSIVSRYNLGDFPELPFITDKNGNTIAHYLCNTGDLNFAKLILRNNEDLFRSSFYITNKDNKKPLECVPIGKDNNKFVEILTNNFLSFSTSFSQFWILDQFRTYLFFQLIHRPQEYSYEAVSQIIQNLQSGHCFGFSSVWAKCCLQKNYHIFPNLLHDIITWNRSYNTLDKSLIVKFETVISLIRSHQDFPFEIREQYYQADDMLAKGLFTHHLKIAKDFKFRQRENLDSYDADTTNNYAYEIVKNWGGAAHYQCESNLLLKPKEISYLEDYFKISKHIISYIPR